MWNKNEIKNTLKDNYEIFSEYFNINEFGYWEKDKYILKEKKIIHISQKNLKFLMIN